MSRFILPYERVDDKNGHPLDGALMYFYVTGTSTPLDTYSDAGLATPNTNPVVADSQGQFGDIYLSGVYRVELQNKSGVTQPGYPVDDVTGVPQATNTPLYFASKADAVTYIDAHGIIDGQQFFITSDDGGSFGGVTGAAPGTYADDGGSYCGTKFIPSGGDGSSAIVRKNASVVNMKWFGAKGDCTISDGAGTITTGTDDSVAISNWITAAALVGVGYAPKGIYWNNQQHTPTINIDTDNASGRKGGFTMLGDGMYESVFYSEIGSANYQFDFSTNGNGDAIAFRDISFKTISTGCGGIKLSEGGNITFDRVFFNGAGAGSWALYMTGPYQVHINDCRFWDDANNFSGGAIYQDDGHTLVINNTFISKQVKNGDIVYLTNIKNILIPSITLESSPEVIPTDQKMLVFDGSNITAWIGTIHGEHRGNVLIDIRDAGAFRNGRIETIYAWSKISTSPAFTNPNAKILVMPNSVSAYNIVVGELFWKHDTTDSSTDDGLLIYDPYNRVKVENFSRADSGGQAVRPLKQSLPSGFRTFSEANRNYYHPLLSVGTTTAPSKDYELPLPGTYLVDATIMSSDSNHGRTGTYLIKWDYSTNSFTSSQLVGAEATKGSGTAALVLSVTNSGVMTVSSSAWTSRNYSVGCGWTLVSKLPSYPPRRYAISGTGAGAYTVGETISGGTSSAAGKVIAWDAINNNLTIFTRANSVSEFQSGETITGATSAAAYSFVSVM